MISKYELAEEYTFKIGYDTEEIFSSFVAGYEAKEKQIKDLYNGYNSQLKEATTNKMGRKEESYEVIKLRGKVELLKKLLDEV